MADIKDRDGRLVQRQQTSSDGKITAYDRDGRLVGTYNPRTNQTLDRENRLVGSGNQLAGLR